MLQQSLILTVLVAGIGNAGATSYCSSSFRFDQLCPDPRFGSREVGTPGGGGGAVGGGGGISSSGSSSHLTMDTYIYLNTDNYPHRGRGGGGGGGSYSYPSSSNSYGGRSYTSSMSIKDPSTTSCDFHRNGVETAVVNAIHLTENPWNFRHANQCSHVVKFSYDLFDKADGGVVGTGGSVGVVGGGTPTKQSVCQNEIGFRRKGSQDIDHRKDKQQGTEESSGQGSRRHHDHDEETAKKMNVYFWHNFTIYPHSAEFVDSIINHHWSKEDISCVNEKRKAQYVQIVVVVSKSGRCEIIVQQYKIDEKRSPWGCTGSASGHHIPYPIQFCGNYDCAQSTSILTGLKLLSRRDSDLTAVQNLNSGQKSLWNTQHGTSTGGRVGGTSMSGGVENGISQQQKNPLVKNGEIVGGAHTYSEYEEGPPCVTDYADTTTPSLAHTQLHSGSSDSGEEDEKEEEPMDWMEVMFIVAFPTGGCILILCVLSVLRNQSAREICRGYTYTRPTRYHNHGVPIGSFTSIDKNGLHI